jgi:hypothetical protein
MPNSPQNSTVDSTILSESQLSKSGACNLSEVSTLELAQALAERLAITPNDWHRLKSNRQARAGEQAAIAMVYLLKNQPEEALVRLQQSSGWLDRSISAPPCPSHGR